MITDSLIRELEEIVNKGLENSLIPHVKGRSIRIKNYVIRESSKGYLIYDILENRQAARTQFKSSAVAIAKNLAQGKDVINQVMVYDRELTKHYNDAVFYRNIIQKTENVSSKEVRKIRLDITLEETARVRNRIDSFIFDN
jgi:hypothetical protein